MTRATRALARLRRIPPALLALLVAGAVLATAWALVVPPLQGPDEAAHVAATTALGERGTLARSAGLPRELLVLADERGLGALVGNLAARPDTGPDARARADAALRALGPERASPRSRAAGLPTRGSARNPLYSAWTVVPYRVARSAPLVDRLALMRLFNVPLLLITIAACWVLAAEALPSSGLARVAAGGLAALQPQLGFISGVVNPDILLVALTSVFCLVAARMLTRGVTLGRVAGMLALGVAATATHGRGAVLLAGALLALLLAVPWHSLPPERRRRLAAGLGALAVAGAAALALAVSRLSRYAGEEGSVREFSSYVWQFYLPGLPFMDEPLGGDYGVRDVHETMWGAFASLEVRYPSWVYGAVAAVLALVVAGGLAAALRGRPRVVAGRRLALLLGGIAVLTLLSLHVAAYRLLLVDPSDPIVVGRHLLMLIGPLAVALAVAVTALPARAAPVACALVLGALTAMDLAALGLTAARFYA